jgi:DNA polymerase II small subunit
MTNSQEILRFCLEKGFLVDKDILDLFNDSEDIESAKLFIDRIGQNTKQKIITKEIFNSNKCQVNQSFLDLPMENQVKLEKLKIKLDLSIEISREVSTVSNVVVPTVSCSNVKIVNNYNIENKKLTVKDFVKYFRNRVSKMSLILQEHAELDNLVSINKISGSKQGISIIGLVSDKKITKNGNLILEMEDLTGKIKVLINGNKKELFEKAEEITLDSVIGIKGSGNREILFVNDFIFPGAILPERKKAFEDERVLFIGDLHIGSGLFMKDNFLKFINYLNGNVLGTEEDVKKIKYIFIVGDLIAGVGNYPNQENELAIVDLEEQFIQAADYLKQIRSDIKIIICPGNHDAVRLMEPQPLFDDKFAWALHELDNVLLTTNPSTANIASTESFEGFNVLMYHGFSFFYYADNIMPLMKQKASHKPELVMKYLLNNRHLSPTHGSNQYYPSEIDSNFIEKIPDIFISGHVHKSGVTYHNNILIVSVSGWEAMTAYMEKRGAKPDFCKVPMFNLKTREVKILDFE